MNRIAEFRKMAGLTQAGAASLAGWGQSRWSSYERGVRTPDATDIQAILAVLCSSGVDASFEELFPVENNAA